MRILTNSGVRVEAGRVPGAGASRIGVGARWRPSVPLFKRLWIVDGRNDGLSSHTMTFKRPDLRERPG